MHKGVVHHLLINACPQAAIGKLLEYTFEFFIQDISENVERPLDLKLLIYGNFIH